MYQISKRLTMAGAFLGLAWRFFYHKSQLRQQTRHRQLHQQRKRLSIKIIK